VPARQPTMAVFTKNRTNPAYAAARLGADRVARAGGARTVHFVPTRPDDVDEQRRMVDHVIADRPDIILFVPVDDGAMVEPVARINAAGIPIVLFINRLPGHFVTFVGADDITVGRTAARALFAQLGSGKVVTIEGVPAAPTSRDRIRGVVQALAEHRGITLLESGVGNYQRPDARRVMAGMLQRHRSLDGVVAINDEMALGALEALRAAGRTAQVVGVNGILEAVRQIEAGTLLASVDFDAFKIACIAAQAALRHLAGEPVPDQIMLPAELIDRANCAAWLRPVDERACPAWDELVGTSGRKL
jgi:ribose transport system substrate-binding protein